MTFLALSDLEYYKLHVIYEEKEQDPRQFVVSWIAVGYAILE